MEQWSPAGTPATSTGGADSFPVILAQQPRRYTAKLAQDLAASGYCSTSRIRHEYLKRVASLPFTALIPARKAPGQEHIGIGNASKVRASRGLLAHIFGRLAAAMLLLNQQKP